MGKKGVVVAGLTVITVMAGFTAAAFTASRVDVDTLPAHPEYCRYRPSAATPLLGIVAAALALTTHVLASTAIGCCGAWRNVPGQTRRVVTVLLFVSSWVLTVKVVILFMVGTMLGLGGYTRNIIVENGRCIAPGVTIFTAAMILFLIVVSLDIASYKLVQKGALDSAKAVGLEKLPSGIAMGTSGAAKC